MLLMQYISMLLPDPLNYYLSGILSSIFWSTSILAIAFPAYILTSWLMERDFANEPAKRHLNVRKWLVYLTLFIAAVTILGDLITLLFNFLNGELTMAFFLKIVIVLAVAGAVFGYYFWDLKAHDKKSAAKRTQIAWIASAVVLISIVLGFVIAGTPGTQRARRFDDQRISDLQMIQGQVLDYWTRKAELPSNAAQLENPISGFSFPRDPDTNMPYEYRKTSDLSFELCANFQLDATQQSSPLQPPYAKYPVPAGGFREPETWMHGAGLACFTRTIDPDFYKPQPQTDFIPTKIR